MKGEKKKRQKIDITNEYAERIGMGQPLNYG